MKDPIDQELGPFFEAAKDAEVKLPEHARRRMLLDAEALQPKPAAPRNWSFSLRNLFHLVPTGAALASLSLGVFVGAWQPDSISALTGFELTAEDELMFFANGFESDLIESDIE